MKTATGADIDAKKLLALGVCLAIGVVFWDQPWLLPLKLLVVAFHESGHAIASLIAGGKVEELVVSANQAGHCISATDGAFISRVLVYSGGYVGSAAMGALLILLTFRFKAQRAVLYVLSAWLLIVTVLWAGDGFTRLFCLGAALTLMLAAKFLPVGAVPFFNLFLAAFTALYAVFDLRSDLWHWDTRGTDASLLAEITWIPAPVWAGLWTLTSLLILALSIWWAVKKGRTATPMSMPPLQTPSLR